MTTYTTIANADIDQDSPVTQPLLTALRDNPIATSEGSTGAPVISGLWHPYDMVAVGDGADGEFYDFAVDGASSAIDTPDFEDGYEYAIYLQGFEANVTVNLRVSFYAAPYNVSTSAASVVAVTGFQAITGICAIRLPRVSLLSHRMEWISDPADSSGTLSTTEYFSTQSVLTRGRVSLESGASSAGKLYLLRRRDYLSA